MNLQPEHVEAVGDIIAIRWNDGEESFLPMSLLRAASPSAENIGEKDLPGRVHGENPGGDFANVRVLSWQPVGGYALQFRFSDGHSTGIYSYDYLKKLAEMNQNGP